MSIFSKLNDRMYSIVLHQPMPRKCLSFNDFGCFKYPRQSAYIVFGWFYFLEEAMIFFLKFQSSVIFTEMTNHLFHFMGHLHESLKYARQSSGLQKINVEFFPFRLVFKSWCQTFVSRIRVYINSQWRTVSQQNVLFKMLGHPCPSLSDTL